MTLNILESILLLLLIAVAISVVFSRLKIPAIVGYLIVGIVVGPHILGVIASGQDTRDIAEFGIVFLLFTIGLEFSLTQVISMRKIVFGYGLLQVLFSVAITALLSTVFNLSLGKMIVIGSIIAMSSTAIVSKQLTEQLEINTSHGINAIGILLLQDLAVIPILILIPSLVSVDLNSLTVNLLWALLKGAGAIFLILGAGRYVLRPSFYLIAARNSVELFTLSVLLVTLGAAWVTYELGLSLALGAFLAGMMLGETEFRHQIETDIRPFRDVLLALFFISIGMQVNFVTLLHAWPWLLLLLFALILFKTVLIYLLGLVFKNDHVTSLRTGLLLAQGGEFGFAILLLAFNYHLLPAEYGQVVLGALLLSMIISPFLIQYNRVITNFLLRGALQAKEKNIKKQLKKMTKGLSNHAVICGYGRVGQNTARIIEQAKIPFVAFDLDAKRVLDAQLAGDNVFYADATHMEVLNSAKLNRAAALIITLRSSIAAKKILQQVRYRHKRLPIIARSYDDAEAEQLYGLGATEVIPDTSESSLVLGSHVLMLMHVPINKVRRIASRIRETRYDLLHWIFPAQTGLGLDETEEMPKGLYVVTLDSKSFSVGKTLEALSLDTYEVSVTRIRRRYEVIIEPKSHVELKAEDVLVLYGPLANLENAEKFLLQGEF